MSTAGNAITAGVWTGGGGGNGGGAASGGNGGGAASGRAGARIGSTTVSRSGAFTAPMPIAVGRASTAGIRGGVICPESARAWRACSATTKNDARSGMSPRRFQVLPLREIIDSRDTEPAMIHCCSVASSRQLRVSPLS